MAKQIIKIGDSSIVVSSVHSSAVYVVGVLGFDKDSKGVIKRIYLDSLIHDGNEYEGWWATGAVSTVLERCKKFHVEQK